MPADPVAGAHNLLVNCGGLVRGDRLLIVAEPPHLGFYDEALAPFIAQQAAALGARVTVRTYVPGSGPRDVPAELLAEIAAADRTLFLNRIGDQLRFSRFAGGGTQFISYTLDIGYLGSAFGVAAYAALEELSRRILAHLRAARRYSIRCPLGTELTMDCGSLLQSLQNTGGFTVKNFPVMIVPPIPADQLRGRLVLSHAMTSTGIHQYADSTVPLPSPIALSVLDGRVVAFEGEAMLAGRVTRQFDRVDAIFGATGHRVGSWHTGINPFTYFLRPALTDLERWSGVAFASPRYTHFHLCGAPPGDICGQVFDATICFDDTPIWERGRLVLLDCAENEDLRAQLPTIRLDAQTPLGL